MTNPHSVHKCTLGQRVRCTVTGFEGIATTRVEWLNGCTQYLVKPPAVQKDGEPLKMPDGAYLDDQQLELVDEGILDPRVQDAVALSAGALSEASVGGPSHREGELPR